LIAALRDEPSGYIGSTVHGNVDGLVLLGPKTTEYIVGGIHVTRRSADTDLEAPEVLSLERGDHGPDTIVSAVATTPLNLQLAERNIDIVVNHQSLIRISAVIATQRSDCLARLVHERARNRNNGPVPSEVDLGDVGSDALSGPLETKAVVR
jgi:hypothetical protein